MYKKSEKVKPISKCLKPATVVHKPMGDIMVATSTSLIQSMGNTRGLKGHHLYVRGGGSVVKIRRTLKMCSVPSRLCKVVQSGNWRL